MGRLALLSLAARVVLGFILAVVWIAFGEPRFGLAHRGISRPR